MHSKNIIQTAVLLGAATVALGAFGAHGLEALAEAGKVEMKDLEIYETAVRYQFYHVFALLGLGLAADRMREKLRRLAALAFYSGIALFSGSLYLLTLSTWLTGSRMSWLGAVTPIGGLLLISGWILFFFGISSVNKKSV